MTLTHWLLPEVLLLRRAPRQVPTRPAPESVSMRLAPEQASMQLAGAAVHSREWHRGRRRVPARSVNVRARGTPSPLSTCQPDVHQLRLARCYSASLAHVLPLGAGIATHVPMPHRIPPCAGSSRPTDPEPRSVLRPGTTRASVANAELADSGGPPVT